MKKVLVAIVVLIVLVGAGMYLFQEPMKEMAIEEMTIEEMTSDMFIASDNDSFDPGLPVGAQFPPILTSLDGATITDVSQYSGPNGLVFVANRSVDW